MPTDNYTLSKELDGATGGTLSHYVATALPLTLLTIWIIVAFQSRFYFRDPEASMLRRLLWPVTFVVGMFSRKTPKLAEEPKEYSFDELP